MDASKTCVWSLFLTRLGYCNSILSGSPKCLIQKLQGVQNTAARITLRIPRTEHTTPLLRMLHWLPIPSRIVTRSTLYATLHWLPHIQNICQIFWMCIHQHDHLGHYQTKHADHCHSKYQVIWRASICIPGTHELEQGPWRH